MALVFLPPSLHSAGISVTVLQKKKAFQQEKHVSIPKSNNKQNASWTGGGFSFMSAACISHAETERCAKS